MAFTLLLTAILLGAGGQLLLKKGMRRYPGFQLQALFALARNPAIIGGFGLYGISTLLYLKVLASLSLSLAYPTVSLGYAIVVIMSRILFQERISRTRWAAVGMICLGVALVGVGAG
ncbi:MAG: EamA family transporter [Acidobacteriota bacterium]